MQLISMLFSIINNAVVTVDTACRLLNVKRRRILACVGRPLVNTHKTSPPTGSELLFANGALHFTTA